ncbi:MAG: hypothetical protein P4N59_18125 [Negativicutes bacterium]|nr:hypothetical protein [Negativicutes bacterium]
MPTRGNSVNYTIPAVTAGASRVTVADLAGMCDIMVTNENELNGVSNVFVNNDRAGCSQTRDSRLPGNSAYLSSAQQAKAALVSGNHIKAADLNGVVGCLNTLAAKFRTSGLFSGPADVTGAASGDTMTAARLGQLTTSLGIISTNLDSKNGWWDSSDYCNINCQVSCQAVCQHSCQSCNTSQGHNQNCGGWS